MMLAKAGEPPLSSVQKFKIYFEYDITWQEAKKQLKLRTVHDKI